MNATRLEHDSLGEREVPADAYWGIHTLRARENFPISGTPLSAHPSLVRALATVKQAAALANGDLGLIPPPRVEAIVAACRRVREGGLHDQFCVDVVQGGAGTSSNMNANEVIANAALEELGQAAGRYDIVHPIGDVNCSQSTNDVYPTAIRLAVVEGLTAIRGELATLADAFEERAKAHRTVLKVGRTQLQDAVPMTVGDELMAFAVAIREDVARLGEAVPLLLECSLGGTAIGTGVTAPAGYREAVLVHLRDVSGLAVVPTHHLFEASWDAGGFLQTSGALRRTAVKLSKICNDLRLLSSGPQAGFGELRLPARQAGSSIMPGKVNPVIPEVVNQIAFSVMGADVTIAVAAEGGQLQLNAFEPIIAHSLLQSVRWMTNGVRVLRELCVEGIEADERVLAERVAVSVGAVTALVPAIGYETAARAAAHALATGTPIADAVASIAGMPREEVVRLLAG
ncbi:aspartate ammonia-lyase [Microbacterium sp. B2969]|uniref:Aspartate ammonia-lyase n=1 Tax=Microbacterium alkaliflavum TaxID=3248839 RepID=A0ABW7QBL1_9MICO